MRTISDIQKDMDALDMKRIRPTAELVASGGTDVKALEFLAGINAQLVVLRDEWNRCTATAGSEGDVRPVSELITG